MNTSEMKMLETNDIQGLLIRSYTNLPVANFLLCHAADKSSLSNFLKIILPKITKGDTNPMDVAINVALTNKGIGLLQLPMKIDFAEDFMEGMDSEFRSRILGDYNKNDQKYWHWGAKHQPEIHFMLMLYAVDQARLQQHCNDTIAIMTQHNVNVIRILDSKKLEGEKEHFGFHDGISQPVLKSLQHKKPGSPDNIVAEGEFIFGYCNEYNQMPISPTLSSNVDIGNNGSYMVFRQIAQDVQAFWQYMVDKNSGDLKAAVHLASKMVGRYPSGTPIVFSPEEDLPSSTATEANDFTFADDEHGYKCPVGSHIRKANPRDRISDDPVESIIVAKRHRILRRGRPYGDPIAPSFQPVDILNARPSKEKEVGLYFIAFNTNISRQFEFIQQQWMNNKKFGALYNDPDPIVGVDTKASEGLEEKVEEPGHFTIQAEPVRKKLVDVPLFTAVKGGAYFFMPGLRALEVISNS